jgi:hypothetical protein
VRRALLLNGGNPADEIAALVIGVAVAFVVWLILRNRVPEDDEDDDDPDGNGSAS